MAVPIDLMHQIDERAKREKEKVFYLDGCEVTYREIPDSHLLFRSARKNKDKSVDELRRIIVVSKTPVAETKAGIRYVTPLSHRKKKNKYFQVVYSCDTVNELGERYGIT